MHLFQQGPGNLWSCPYIQSYSRFLLSGMSALWWVWQWGDLWSQIIAQPLNQESHKSSFRTLYENQSTAALEHLMCLQTGLNSLKTKFQMPALPMQERESVNKISRNQVQTKWKNTFLAKIVRKPIIYWNSTLLSFTLLASPRGFET